MDASERKSEVRAEGAETPPASEPAAATPAASTPAASPSPRRRRARAHRHRWWRGPLRTIAGFVILGALIVFAVLAFTGRPLPAPHWLADQIEARVNRALQGGLQVKIGGIEAIVDDSFIPRVRLADTTLLAPSGAVLATLPDVRASVEPAPLLRGEVALRSLQLNGARLAIRLLPDGRLDLPDAGLALGAAASIGPVQMVEALEAAFATPALAGLERIEAQGIAARIEDLGTGHVWTAADGKLTLDQTTESIAIGIGLDLRAAGTEAARAEIDFTTRKDSPEAHVEARVKDIPSRDLAAQSPALAWLAALDAPISGLLRSGIDADGAIGRMSAELSIGAGGIEPSAGAAPVPFDAVSVTMAYDPAAALLTFSDLAFDSRALRLGASGKAWLTGSGTEFPSGLVAQIAIADLKADPEGLFANPVTISQGASDIKIDFNPFSVRIGQLVLIDQGHRISAKGRVLAEPGGWNVSLDVAIDAIESARLLALWPVRAVPRTRAWLAENVATADLRDLNAALRTRPGAEPRLSLSYDFRAADVRFLRTLPPILAGAGYATIDDYAYTLVLDEGHVISPAGGRVDVAGSVLKVPDIRQKPATANVRLFTDSAITDALALLDEPPFRFLTKSGRSTDLAEGRAQIRADLTFPLKPKVPPAEVDYRVTGTLTGLSSDRLVPGRTIASDALQIAATPRGMTIYGPGTLSGLPFDALWRQEFGEAAKGRSRVEGEVELSPRFLDTFGIALPEGSVTGDGKAEIALDISEGAPTRFTMTSNLTGLALKVPGLSWRKPAGATGALTVEGALGKPPAIDKLSLSAEGLSAEGSVTLSESGALQVASFTSLSVGDFFDGALDIRGQGKGKPVGLFVRGGTADLRQTDALEPGGGPSPPLEVSLDRLRVTNDITLQPFEGSFRGGGGFNGTFRASVNGTAPVSGTVVPVKNRSAFRIRSADAGAAMRAAGVFKGGRGGDLDLTLVPFEGAGTYDGRLSIRNIRVVDAPILAELLGLISVIGLLEQLNGTGILFADVRGEFRMTPGAIEIRDASAVGASLGVSAEGVYSTAARSVDIRGTVSPIYLVNAVGQIFSKRREGLFGFNYRMTGPVDQTRIAVNPLSIFTPGMFREIFRAPPPKVSE